MSFNITVQPSGRTFVAEADEALFCTRERGDGVEIGESERLCAIAIIRDDGADGGERPRHGICERGRDEERGGEGLFIVGQIGRRPA